ncbi:MAG: universal stress protein [Acidimicrobiia bacterium]
MRRIVVGIDGSPGSQIALRWAVREAKIAAAGVAGSAPVGIDAIGVWNYPVVAGAPGAVIPVRPMADQGADTMRNLQECIDGLGAEAKDVPIDTIVAEGGAAQMLCEAAKDADLLVVGTRGSGRIRRLILGSVSNQVIHHSPCPVALIPPEAVEALEPSAAGGTVIVGVDGSEAAAHALKWAAAEGARRNWPVDVVYAWEPFVPFGRAGSYVDDDAMAADAQVVLDRVMFDAFGGDVPAHVHARTAPGDPSQVLVDAAGPSDVLVVGTRGRGGFLGLHLGSVATHCAHHTRSPLVLVR